MVLIGNTRLDIFSNDTTDDIISRIADSLGTLPEYLKVDLPDKKTMLENDKLEIDVFDILGSSREYSDSINFREWVDKIPMGLNIPPIEIVKIWTSQNKKIGENDLFVILLETEAKQLFGDIFNPFDFLKYDDGKNKFLRDLEGRLSQQRELVKNKYIAHRVLGGLEKVRHTDFNLEKIIYNIKTNSTLTPLEIFDKFMVNTTIPFLTSNYYFKMTEDFIPVSDWITSEMHNVILKVLTKTHYNLRERPSLNDMYDNVIIYGKNTEIDLYLNNRTTPSDRDFYINKIVSSIDITPPLQITEIQQSGVSGVFYLPKTRINKYIFLDMVMNDPLFSNYVGIDESIKPSKKKMSLYLYFNDPSKPEYGDITANITSKMAERKDVQIKQFDREQFPYGISFTRVKITKAKSEEAVRYFTDIFCKMITHYGNNYKKIGAEYVRFIPSFIIEEKERIREYKKLLKEIAPDLFLPDYSRKCAKPPIIIGSDEVKDWESKGRDTMLFPKIPEEGKQHIYTCPDDTFKYIGVRKNPLENKNKYPYIPCCYRMNQKDRKQSTYKEYFMGQEKKEQTQAHLFITDKFAETGGIAKLPDNLELMFKSFDSENKYFRKGVNRTKSSFLECVLEILDDNFYNLPPSGRKSYIDDIRTTILPQYAFLAKQHLYDKTIEEIQNIIVDTAEYFDPKIFLDLVGEYFECNIYIFQRTYEQTDAELLIPRHINGYYKIYNPYNTSIILYENAGSESDNAQYPQLETIVRQKKNTFKIEEFDHKEPVRFLIQRAYTDMFRQESKLNPNVKLDVKMESIQNQYVDNCGKIRFLELNNFIVMTSPLPIFKNINFMENIPSRKEYELTAILEQGNILNLTLTGLSMIGDKIKEVRFRNGTVFFYYPCIATTKPPRYRHISNYEMVFPDIEENNIQKYRTNKRIANCIRANMFYLYSKYMLEYKENTNIIDFANKHISIINDYKYPEPNIELSSNNGYIKNNIITLHNTEISKRLLYELGLINIRNPKFIEFYHENNIIENFYQNIDDFKKYKGQIIIKGEEIISQLYLRHITDNKIYNYPQSNIFTYYFRNNQIVGNDKIYMINTYINIQDGFSTLYNSNEILESIFIVLDDNNSVKKYTLKGLSTNSNIVIIAYKHQSVNRFAFLLPVNQ